MDSKVNSLIESLKGYSVFDLALISLTFEIKGKLDNKTVLEGFSSFCRENPEFAKLDYDHENENFNVVNSKDSEKSEQVSFSLSNFDFLSLTIGTFKIMNYKKYFDLAINLIENHFKFSPAVIGVIGVQFFSSFDIEKNHYKLFEKTFFKDSKFPKIFDDNAIIIDNTISIKARINNFTSILKLDSDQIEHNILKEDYKNTKLNCLFGVGYIKGISFDQELKNIIAEQTNIFEEYLTKYFLSEIITPLMKTNKSD